MLPYSFIHIVSRLFPLFLITIILIVGSTEPALAQTSPVDLTDLTLEELLEVEAIEESPSTTSGFQLRGGKLHFEYRYIHVKFEGYRDGTDRISNSELLGGPPSDNVFPVLPTRINQEAHVFSISYAIQRATSLNLFIPFLKQSTHHISVVSTYESFKISSQGFGDLTLTVSQRLLNESGHSFLLTGGISLPTGSIDEKGDTPRDTGQPEEQLPYTMQLGSGTYDLIVGMDYGSSTRKKLLNWNIRANGKIRTGDNSRDYRLGNLFVLSAALKARPMSWLEPFIKISGHLWGKINGEDIELQLAPGVFPAPVTDPDNFGGRKILVLGGLSFNLPRVRLEIEFGLPVYQNLNGPQPEEDWRINLSWSLFM